FWLFMLGYFTLAAGITILQVAANPYVTILGDPKTASSRLNLAQAFNSLGTTIAPILGAIYLLSDDIRTSDQISKLDDEAIDLYYASEASAVQSPFLFLAIALILLTVFVLLIKLPKLLDTESPSNYGDALKDKKLVLGAIGIFVYVGAEVAIGSFAVNYFSEMGLESVVRANPTMNSIAEFIANLFGKNISIMDGKGVLGLFLTFYWGGAMIGRFIGSILTAKYKPNKILSLFATLAILFVGISMSTTGLVAMWSIIAVGLFNSIMFPTIFSIAIEDLGDLKPQGSGILCTAIAGGAIIPPLYGLFTDNAGFKIAFLLVIACYAYILFYGRKSLQLTAEKN
ncbi:MAG: FHS family L-fucose permease-like MFS transporter, partial [Granulosicoccus sp.]